MVSNYDPHVKMLSIFALFLILLTICVVAGEYVEHRDDTGYLVCTCNDNVTPILYGKIAKESVQNEINKQGMQGEAK